MAGIEPIFFTVAGMRLFFGLVLNTELTIERYFCYCGAGLTQSHHIAFCSAMLARRLAVHERLGGNTDRLPRLTKGIFHTCI